MMNEFEQLSCYYVLSGEIGNMSTIFVILLQFRYLTYDIT